MAARGIPSHLDLNVGDGARSVAFYAVLLGTLGYERHAIEPGRREWWSIDVGGATFGIEVRPAAHPPPRRRHERYAPGIDHLAFHADTRDTVDAVCSALVQAGYDVDEPPREYDYAEGYDAVAFDDPDGIRLEVCHDPTSNP